MTGPPDRPPPQTPRCYPGPASQPLLAELGRYVLADPYPFVLDLAHGHGMYLVTVDGQEILDWSGYYGSKLLGHNHPCLAEPEYVRRLVVAANNKTANPDFLTPECLAYYRLIHGLAPRCMQNDRLEVYAVNSGAEAVENMMKYLINLHHYKLLAAGVQPTTHRFIYFDQAFHGRTVFALNVTQIESAPLITRDFHGLVAGNLRMKFPAVHHEQPAEFNAQRAQATLQAIEQALQQYGRQIAGIIVEPIQGAGGHRVASPDFFRSLSELAHRYDVFLGFDEVQTAGGQTGAFFAIDLFDLPYPPQAVATGKKLGNGVVYMLYPMQDRGVLDSTWGGSLTDMVRFVQEMQVVRDEQLIEQVPAKAARLVEGLARIERQHHRLLFNVRGLGLYQGFTLRRPELRQRLLDRALEEEDMLLLGAGRMSIRLRPPLSVTEGDIERMLEKLDRCLGGLGE
ncbi:MAG: aminotransferase class III-fold pyridoxal phosphate-dependent enzyme [Candidatus Latescibacterota bacterium]